jgi:hypothetical protein
MQVMGVPLTPAMEQVEREKATLSEADVAEKLGLATLITQRIPGFALKLRESEVTSDDLDAFIRGIGDPSRRKKAFDIGMIGMTGMIGVGMSPFQSPAAEAREAALEAKRRAEAASAQKSESEREWIAVSDALREDCQEHAWFRLSLLLLSELCNERNAYAQRVVSCMLPAECLISVMEVRDTYIRHMAYIMLGGRGIGGSKTYGNLTRRCLFSLIIYTH